MPSKSAPYQKAAGGLDAIKQTVLHGVREAGALRATRALLNMNQREGFDCPGCAWPEPSHRSVTEFCENGAKALADIATTKRVDAEFFARWSIEAQRAQSDQWLNDQGRLTEPVVKYPGQTHYQPIAWDDAFALIANTLLSLASPDEALFYTSGRTSNEAAYLYQLFVRHLGTNNLPDCSNMCHESSGTGMSESVGIGKGTVSLADFELADAILVVGQNPGTNHPRMLSTLQAARRRGAQIISINPLKERALERFIHPQEVTKLFGSGEAIANLFLQVKIGGDIALLKGLAKAILEQESSAVDWAFIKERTEGFENYLCDVKQTSFEAIEASSGIARSEIESCAKVLASSKRIIACWAMGLTQHEHGVANIQEITNLMLLLGQIAKPGAGLCPVRGHSNVQGDRTMGIWEKPKDAFLDALKARYDFEPPRHHGHDTVGAIEAMLDGRARVFFALGGNFLSASPDTAATAQALERCTLSVHVSTKLNRAHLHVGDTALILPTLSRVEKDLQEGGLQMVSVEDSMAVVHRSQGLLRPASPSLLSEVAIIARLAARCCPEAKVDWLGLCANYDRIRDEIEAVIPGFERFNARLREPDGFVLPKELARTFKFVSHPLPSLELEKDQLFMMTIRSHDQFNTSVYSSNDRYRGIKGSRWVLLMNEADIASRGLKAGDEVTVTSHFRGEQRHLRGMRVVPYDLPKGCSASYFPEANALVPLLQCDKKSRTPASKSLVISVTP